MTYTQDSIDKANAYMRDHLVSGFLDHDGDLEIDTAGYATHYLSRSDIQIIHEASLLLEIKSPVIVDKPT